MASGSSDKEVILRTASQQDIPFLQRMAWLAILASPGLVAARGLERLQAIEAERWATWPAADEIAVVAEDANGQQLGALVLFVHEREGDRVVGYRLAIGVEEAARRRGVGRRLIDYAKRYAAEARADYVYLQVDPANEFALRLYLAAGFEHGDPRGLIPMVLRFAKERAG